MFVDGEKVGGAEVEYFSKPIQFYQLSDLYVEYDHQGKGYGTQLMDQLEQWLIEKKKPGVLVDAIWHDNPAKGMYERRGWKEIPDSLGIHVYNWPENLDISMMRNYSLRSRKYDDLES